jgi:hypothetical protein
MARRVISMAKVASRSPQVAYCFSPCTPALLYSRGWEAGILKFRKRWKGDRRFTTVVGEVAFGAQGEWAHSRVLQVQYHNIKGHDLAQFKDMSTQVVVAPAEYASGEPIYPYEKAK